jgi:N-acetyl-gamma-glutamyl-phosphate reductase
MKPKIFVDGQEGTTGLRIHEYLSARSGAGGDLDVLRIDAEKRKDLAERKKLINAADVVFLCLPDAASQEAVSLVENERTRVIDASTAFRTDPAWAYGLPELSKAAREKIRHSRRIANPGCHASAFLLGIAPLVAAGLVNREAALTCFSITGYSGGGKKMIAAYEAADAPAALKSPRHYSLKFGHKHLPEMRVQAGLAHVPAFTPVVCATYSGLAAEVFLPAGAGVLTRKISPGDVRDILARHYEGERFVKVMPFEAEAHVDAMNGFDITACNGTNRADVFIFGNEEQMAVMVRLDNLGKGASGAAVQCMNLALGMEETTGLV